MPYKVLRDAPGDGAVFDLTVNRTFNPEAAQVQHRKPFCCLDLPRKIEPPALQELDATHPAFGLLRRFAREGNAVPLPAEAPGPDQARELADLGFAWVMLHDRRPSEDAAGCWPDVGADGKVVRCSPKYTAHAVLRAMFGDPVIQEKTGLGWLSLYAVDGRTRAQDAGNPVP
jgi:hypothetical protein